MMVSWAAETRHPTENEKLDKVLMINYVIKSIEEPKAW